MAPRAGAQEMRYACEAVLQSFARIPSQVLCLFPAAPLALVLYLLPWQSSSRAQEAYGKLLDVEHEGWSSQPGPSNSNEDKHVQVTHFHHDVVDAQRVTDAPSQQPQESHNVLAAVQEERHADSAAADDAPQQSFAREQELNSELAAAQGQSRQSCAHEQVGRWIRPIAPSARATAPCGEQLDARRTAEAAGRRAEAQALGLLLASILSTALYLLLRQGRSLAQESDSRVAAVEEELRQSRSRLGWWEVSEEWLADTTTSEVVKWRRELEKASQCSLARLDDRQVELRVAAATAAVAESALCKVCLATPVSCVLLPCRHHAFCAPCCQRLQRSPEPVCPLCRVAITDVLETFAG